MGLGVVILVWVDRKIHFFAKFKMMLFFTEMKFYNEVNRMQFNFIFLHINIHIMIHLNLIYL